MANRIVLVQNQSFKHCEPGTQEHIENALKRVVGAKTERAETVAKAMELAQRKDCIFAIPVLLPQNFDSISKARKEIQKFLPCPWFFGICFLLVPSNDFSDESLLDESWVETIDTFYDEAIPTQFVALHGSAYATQWFHVSSAMASLFRDIDNLRELERIGSTLSDLERRISLIENQTDA